MLKELRATLIVMIALIAITGLAYPFAATGLAQTLFPHQAAGSLIEKNGQVIGSELIGQNFTDPGYFWGRPSATSGTPYNAASSGGSNLAPSAQTLVDGVAGRVAAFKKANPDEKGPIPVDLVTTSASGLDPHISPEAALVQVKRVASARHIVADDLRTLVDAVIEERSLGLVGEPAVNVLKLNLALDERWPMR